VAVGRVDIRPLNKNFAASTTSGCPLRLGELLGDNVEVESPYSEVLIGTGTADTSEIIKEKISATRPARERIYEYMLIVGPAD
jgi:hypothetical protein